MDRHLHITDARKRYNIRLDSIIYCEADGNYSDIYLNDINKATSEVNLQYKAYKSVRIQIGQLWQKIEELGKFEDHTLMRAGRSHIVNLKYIQHVSEKGVVVLNSNNLDVTLTIKKPAARELSKAVVQLIKGQKKQVVTIYADKKKLTIPRHKLNDDLTFEESRMYVDLGLSSGTMWATMNIGEGGMFLEPYYAWGAWHEFNSYSRVRYDHRTKKEVTIDGSHLSLKNDIARQQWGGRWRMPTEDEVRELVAECDLKWCSIGNRRRAILVTGRNGNRIVIPVSGCYKDDDIRDDGFRAYLWTSTLYEDNPDQAWSIFFGEEDDEQESVFHRVGPKDRSIGMSIRPVFNVCDKREEEKLSEKKTVIIFHEYIPNFSLDAVDEYPEAMARSCLRMGEWTIIEKVLSMNPEEAFDEVKQTCTSIQPDIIVGITTACTFVNQITDYTRVLIDPSITPSKKLREHINYAMRADDIEEKARRDDQIKQFEHFESAHPFIASDKLCYIAQKEKSEEEIEGCYYVRLPIFNVLARWRRIFLYPLLLKISKNELIKRKPTLDELCKSIVEEAVRSNEALQRDKRELDDDF